VALPLPIDPITRKPFGYRLDDSTAYLSTPSPRPEKIGPAFTAEFEITIRK
jgi:Uma2 family endonuclease